MRYPPLDGIKLDEICAGSGVAEFDAISPQLIKSY
jgi:hypothetical protein